MTKKVYTEEEHNKIIEELNNKNERDNFDNDIRKVGITLKYMDASGSLMFHLGCVLSLENINPKTQAIKDSIKNIRTILDDIVKTMKCNKMAPQDYSIEKMERELRKELGLRDDEPLPIDGIVKMIQTSLQRTGW